jgi:DNA-binding CsgD family transcriptional regulator
LHQNLGAYRSFDGGICRERRTTYTAAPDLRLWQSIARAFLEIADMDQIASDVSNREKILCIPLAKRSARLTAQETECLRWCKEGKTNWEIGEILIISEKTVEFHLGNVMRKLGASNRIRAVITGIKNGLIPL